jgi:hypothetical protein
MKLLCVWSKFYGQATKSMREDALAQEGDEGRGQLRKASGRSKHSIYPGMSEWRNPASVYTGHPVLNT